MKFRKKPVVIEAIQFNHDIMELSEFVGNDLFFKGKHENEQPYIKTLEGDMLVNVGDYVIKGVQGEFYPCKPDIFEQTYSEYKENNE